MAELLIVEDEISINELLSRNLKLVGHSCVSAYSGIDALEQIKNKHFDLILLDIMLPGMSGLEVMRQATTKQPVILITARASLNDRIMGLDSGADDYIVKPFETLEVIARVNAVLRRVHRYDSVFDLRQTHVDLAARKAYVCGVPIDLTPQEFALLEALIMNRNLALSRDKLLELAWGFDYLGDTRTVDVHIQKLRKKLQLEDCIKTVYKMGYRLETQNEVLA